MLYGTAATDTGQLLITLERVIFMSQSKIKLNATEEVQEFVNAATRCDFDVDVYYNRMPNQFLAYSALT